MAEGVVNFSTKLAARVGLAPTPNGLTDRRATFTLPGNGAAGRIPTCISPLRRRMPDVFGHDSNLKMALSMGLAPTLFPQTTGCFSIQLREHDGLPCKGWWEVLVTLQFVASDTYLKT